MRAEIYTACGLLFIALGVPSNAQSEAEATLAVEAGAPLTVECRVRVEQRADWRLDGAAVPADLRAGGEAPAPGGALAARLWTPAARPHHAGRYTCSADPRAAAVRVAVLPPSPRARTNDGGDADMMVLDYDVGRPFSVNCSQLLGKGPISWSKNGTALEKVSDLSGRYKLQDDESVFALEGRSHEQDYGNYSCAAGAEALVWQVQGRPYMRLPRNTNVVEGQKLKITCKVLGLPHASVEWTVERGGVNVSAAAALGERVRLDGPELELSAAQTADGGDYYCAPGQRGGLPVNGTAAVTTVRVKDMYAALWPFLGICAEVFVLCAIILVYEKRRTKPELDDSDTDNHDQKKS